MKDVNLAANRFFGEKSRPSGMQKISAEKTSARKRGEKEGSSKGSIRSPMRNKSKGQNKNHSEILKDLIVRSHYNFERFNMNFNR